MSYKTSPINSINKGTANRPPLSRQPCYRLNLTKIINYLLIKLALVNQVSEDLKSIFEVKSKPPEKPSFWRKQAKYFLHGFIWWLFNVVGLFIFPPSSSLSYINRLHNRFANWIRNLVLVHRLR